jgi:uncharacterized membrane protein YkvI
MALRFVPSKFLQAVIFGLIFAVAVGFVVGTATESDSKAVYAAVVGGVLLGSYLFNRGNGRHI